eukprot:COSAG05_NODE_8924_length_661_cov_0.768683_1_plen_86_part_00
MGALVVAAFGDDGAEIGRATPVAPPAGEELAAGVVACICGHNKGTKVGVMVLSQGTPFVEFTGNGCVITTHPCTNTAGRHVHRDT